MILKIENSVSAVGDAACRWQGRWQESPATPAPPAPQGHTPTPPPRRDQALIPLPVDFTTLLPGLREGEEDYGL